VVALGWSDAETALALGVQPVGASDWLGFGGEGVGPWAAGRYDEAPQIIDTLEPSLEAIAALKPDGVGPYQTLVSAFSSSSALGIQYALENAVPLFAAAL
jgi:ABC-type Fe3+-hydroxamate transport system substrate-binding protein